MKGIVVKLFSLIVALSSTAIFSGCLSSDSKTGAGSAASGGSPIITTSPKSPGIKNPDPDTSSNYSNLNLAETSDSMIQELVGTPLELSDEEVVILKELQVLDAIPSAKLATTKNGEYAETPVSRFFELSEKSRSILTEKLDVVSGWYYGFQKKEVIFYFPNAWTNADSRGGYDYNTGQFKFETRGESGDLLIVAGPSKRGEMIRKIVSKFEYVYLNNSYKDGPWKSKSWNQLLNLLQAELFKHKPEGYVQVVNLENGQCGAGSSATAIWNLSDQEQILINLTNPLPVYGEASDLSLSAGSEDWLFESGIPISKAYTQLNRELFGLVDLEYEIRSFVPNEKQKFSKHSKTVFVAHEILDVVKPKVITFESGWRLFDSIGMLDSASIQVEAETPEVLVFWQWEEFEKSAIIQASGTGKFIVSACDRGGNCVKESFYVDTSIREVFESDVIDNMVVTTSPLKW